MDEIDGGVYGQRQPQPDSKSTGNSILVGKQIASTGSTGQRIDFFVAGVLFQAGSTTTCTRTREDYRLERKGSEAITKTIGGLDTHAFEVVTTQLFRGIHPRSRYALLSRDGVAVSTARFERSSSTLSQRHGLGHSCLPNQAQEPAISFSP